MSMPLLRNGGGLKAPVSIVNLADWQEKEKRNLSKVAVDEQGFLLDNLTLELRVHPPEVNVDNGLHETATVVTIDSANRPGSLVFVVQHFTELGLRITSARISSDGGWFHDVFHVTEPNGEKVKNPKKIESIKHMLDVYLQDDEEVVDNGDDTDDMNRVETTVFQLAGHDRPGLLSEVTDLLIQDGCNVRSAAVWTYRGRVAFVLSVTEKGRPIGDKAKLSSLKAMVTEIMCRAEGAHKHIVDVEKRVRGEVHHDRRLHKLMLREEIELWSLASEGGGEPSSVLLSADSIGSPADSASSLQFASMTSAAAAAPAPAAAIPIRENQHVSRNGDSISPYRSPKFDRPQVDIEYLKANNYWSVNIHCRDRTKLLFDTVCTLADMDYDIWHATIDGLADSTASQEYYVRPRGGGSWDQQQAEMLKAMLASSIQRRFPKGLKIHVHSLDRFGCLAALAKVLNTAHLSVTRAKVRTYATSNTSGHTFYVMDATGGPPERSVVQEACQQIGGRLVGANEAMNSGFEGNHKFSFAFLQRQWATNWGGGGSSPGDSSYGSI